VLISNAAATSAAPAGLLAGVTPLTATAGDGSDALLGDIRKLLAAIAPAIRPVMIASSVQAASIGVLSQSPLPVIAAPTLAADQIIAVDAAAFASSLGAPDFSTDENPTVHMESAAPLPIATPGSPPTIAAPTQSLWQTAAIGLRCLIDCDRTLRRADARVAKWIADRTLGTRVREVGLSDIASHWVRYLSPRKGLRRPGLEALLAFKRTVQSRTSRKAETALGPTKEEVPHNSFQIP
jgi:hypothetical protein